MKVRAIFDLVTMAAVVVVVALIITQKSGSTRPVSANEEVPVPTDLVPLDGAATIGSTNARVALIEFSDFECPFCAQFAHQVMPALEERYVKSGQLLVAFRHYALEAIHPRAVRLAQAGVCADRQRLFWNLHSSLFRTGQSTADEALIKEAAEAGLDTLAFEKCLQIVGRAEIDRDHELGVHLGVRGTPIFFIGSLTKTGVKVSQVIQGAAPVDRFAAAVEHQLQ